MDDDREGVATITSDAVRAAVVRGSRVRFVRSIPPNSACWCNALSTCDTTTRERNRAVAEWDPPGRLTLVWVARGLSGLLGVAGLVGLGLSVSGQASLPFAFGQSAASLLVIASAVILFRSSAGRELPAAGLLPGELALDGAFLYLAMTAPTFHGHHAVSRGVGIAQFAIVILELAAGCGALVFFRTTQRDPRSAFAMAVRSGVMLAVGSLLLAMAIAAVSASTFHLPRWNWASFLGLTAPGILVLIAREEVKKQRWGQAGNPALASLGTEGLLVIGLAVMVWGSTANLTLGVDAFRVGIQGDAVGAGLWVLAAVALLARRVLWPGDPETRLPEFAPAVAYSAALVLFVVGERAVVLGRSPAVAIGQGSVAGVLVALAAVAVLVIMRPVTFALDHVEPLPSEEQPSRTRRAN